MLKQKYKYVITALVLILLISSRFVLLDRSARFIWDESDDLLRMQQIYDNHRITLVGPISGNNINIYGSLSYYMLMPFTVAMDFDPLGPAFGTAFYSVVMIALLAYFFSKKLKWSYAVAILFLLAIFPFVQTGRWAWNPHYIPFWQTLSLLVLLIPGIKKRWYLWILIGFLQGLGIHNHWYAIFSMAGVFMAMAIHFLKEKKWKELVAYVIGGFGAILPFIVFDLLRPPGLFISRLLYFSPITQGTEAGFKIDYVARLWQLPYQFIHYFFQNDVFTIIFIVVLAGYAYHVFRHGQKQKFLLLIPVVVQIACLIFISNQINDHYYLPAVIFFLLFLCMPDDKKRFSFFQKSILIIFITLSIPASISEITKNDWSTNISRTKKITRLISDNIDGKRCNIMAIASQDSGTTGKKYRDLLEVWGTKILNKEEYTDYDCLFVVSTSDIKTIQKDPSYELDLIRKNKPVHVWEVEGEWKLYKFVRTLDAHAK
ncbi:hypothetical protein BH09PAT2_BH09PAT2_07890 [soil metagenome]